MNLRTRLTINVLVLMFVSQSIFSQESPMVETNGEFVILAGTIQPLLLQGWNLEINYLTKKYVLEYSHGWSLELRGATVVGAVKDQGLSIHLPYSTGFGVGYRITDKFNARFEGKVHNFHLYYGDEVYEKDNSIASYNTTTLGIGLYYMYKPFGKCDNVLRRITTSTSIRYWHRVHSTLENDSVSYFNRLTNSQKVHEASEIGIANTPWIFNISIGYSFVVKRR